MRVKTKRELEQDMKDCIELKSKIIAKKVEVWELEVELQLQTAHFVAEGARFVARHLAHMALERMQRVALRLTLRNIINKGDCNVIRGAF